MRLKTLAVASLGVFSLCFLLVPLSAQRLAPKGASPKKSAAAKPKSRTKPTVIATQQPIPKSAYIRRKTPEISPLDVPPAVWNVLAPSSLPGDQALYQKVAATLSQITAVPNDRTNYYSGVTSYYTIASWKGSIRSVTAVAGGGYNVKVAVFPVLQNNTQIMVINDYSETYYLDQNLNSTYTGFLDPNNLSGTWQGAICL